MRGRVPARALALARRHALFLAVLAVAAAVRAVVDAAYRPALLFFGDSYYYLHNALHLEPGIIRPLGYPALLRPVLALGGLPAVPPVQHLAGLATGVAVYALAVRLGAPRVLAVIGSLPVLFDEAQLVLEQYVMAEAAFELLLVLAALLLLWRRRPGAAAAGAAGALLAAATLTRTSGLLLVLPAAALVAGRRAWRPLAALVAGFAVPLLLYAAWFQSVHGTFSITAFDGRFLYGRVAPFARCDLLSASDRRLCDPRPVSLRGGPNEYVWATFRPAPGRPERRPHRGFRLPVRLGLGDGRLRAFAVHVIEAQPGDYLRTVAGDMLHYAAFSRSTGPRDEPVANWTLRAGEPTLHPQARLRWARELGGRVGTDPALARWAAAYGRRAQTPGTLLAAAAILAAAAGACARRGDGRRGACLLLAAFGVLLPLTAALTSLFDYRYLVPSFPFLGPAGVLGADALVRRFAPAALRQPLPAFGRLRFLQR